MKDKYEVSRDSLEKKEMLGAGNFGEVWRGVCLQIQFLNRSCVIFVKKWNDL